MKPIFNRYILLMFVPLFFGCNKAPSYEKDEQIHFAIINSSDEDIFVDLMITDGGRRLPCDGRLKSEQSKVDEGHYNPDPSVRISAKLKCRWWIGDSENKRSEVYESIVDTEDRFVEKQLPNTKIVLELTREKKWIGRVVPYN